MPEASPDRHGPGRPDLRNSWQVVAGSLLVPVGVVIILLAWYGSAHTPYLQQQIPYLVSGSFIGLGCMILGGLLYWAHWLYRLYDQADLHHEEELRVMEGALLAIVDRLAPPAGGGGPTRLVATATGTVFHDPDCPVVAHHRDHLRALRPGDLGTMEPCGICRPDREEAGAVPTLTSGPGLT